jgi:hypothetical protein
LYFSSFHHLPSRRRKTTGRIAGTVQDQNNAVIVGANVTITGHSTGEERTATTDSAGNLAAALLAPGVYRVRVEAKSFNAFIAETIAVSITETATINATLTVAGVVVDPITVENTAPLIKTDNPTLGQVFDGRAIAAFPLATLNFTQLLGLTASRRNFQSFQPSQFCQSHQQFQCGRPIRRDYRLEHRTHRQQRRRLRQDHFDQQQPQDNSTRSEIHLLIAILTRVTGLFAVIRF